MQNRYSIFSFLIACLLIIGVAIAYPKWDLKHTNATISWDVFGYYLYLPSTFIYKDLKKLSFKDQVLDQYKPADSFYHGVPVNNGNYTIKYPIGLAIQMLPFFIIALVMAKIGGYPLDGFSYPFQFCISWGSILVAFVGLWIMRKVLLKYFDDLTTAIVLFLLAFATNYLNYSAIDGAMTHNYLFTSYALLIWLTISWHEKQTIVKSLLIGALIGLMIITRPVEIIAALIPVLWGVDPSISGLRQRFDYFKLHFGKLSLALAATIIVGSIQLIYWKITAGQFFFYSYEEQGFYWSSPYLFQVMLSVRKGWLIYTPAMVLALIGFYFLWKQHRTLLLVAISYFCINYYVVSAWEIWWYGGSFGQRALVQSYAMLCFPLGALISWAWRSNWTKIPLTGFLLFCAWLNLLQTYQSHGSNGFLPPDMMTKEYYIRIFGRLSIDKTDLKLLDTDEDFIGTRYNVKEIAKTGFEDFSPADSIRQDNVFEGENAAFISGHNHYSPTISVKKEAIKGEWIRAKAYLYAPWREWNMWKMPYLVVQFSNKGEIVKKRFIRVHRIIPLKEYTPFWIDATPPDEPWDTISTWVQNSGSTTHLYIDNLSIETFDE